MLCDYIINLLAEATFLLLLIIGGYLWLVRGRRPMLRFFGVEQSRRLVIYWSRLRIILGGSVGVDGQQRKFGGQAVPFSETLLLPVYQRLFNYPVPGLSDAPGPLRRVFLADVDLEAAASPVDSAQRDTGGSLIAVGSPGYNGISLWIENSLHAPGRFIQENSAIEVSGVQPFTDPLHCFVQRVRIADGPAMAFYAAGMTERATQCAQYFLATRWAYLRERFGDRENFCVVLLSDPHDYRRYTELLARGEP